MNKFFKNTGLAKKAAAIDPSRYNQVIDLAGRILKDPNATPSMKAQAQALMEAGEFARGEAGDEYMASRDYELAGKQAEQAAIDAQNARIADMDAAATKQHEADVAAEQAEAARINAANDAADAAYAKSLPGITARAKAIGEEALGKAKEIGGKVADFAKANKKPLIAAGILAALAGGGALAYNQYKKRKNKKQQIADAVAAAAKVK